MAANAGTPIIGKRKHHRQRVMSEINVTPMVDVMLVLLIIFMAYGYVLHKDYSLAEQSFRDYLKKYPNERLVPEAQYWLGESLFQQQRYRDAAESFLGVSTKFERSAKAPDSLLRLGQSLAAMSQKEAACATLAEVGRKYPRASANVKRGVEQEQKRAHC